MLDLERLRVLREVAARGSFSGAAEALYVSQSAVSQQVSALEAEAGVQLLLRLRGGPVLTEAGELLVCHADAAIARLEQAERELAELSGMGAGELRLISFPSASATVVTAAAAAFRRKHPEIRLSLTEGDPEDSIPQLKRGGHDLAVVYDFELHPFEPDRDLELRPLLTEQMHVALALDHPLADREEIELEQLADESWLCGATNGSCRELTIRSCQRAGFEPDVSFESNDYNVMQSLVAAGMGVTLLPDLALGSPHPGVRIVPVAPAPPVRRVWAATLAAGSRSRATESMLDVLAEVSAGFAAQAPQLARAA
jgi:DNA-binding transcriptional LysR family regulator